MFLAAVTGFLSPPLPPAPPPPPPPRRGRAAVVPPHRISATLNFPGGSFNADAWREVAAGATGGDVRSQPQSAPEEPKPSSGSSFDRRGDEEPVDLDVEKLPTFAFFTGDGGRLRKDIIGGSNARSCGAKLQNMLESLWGGAGRPPSQRPQAGSAAGKEDVVGGGGGIGGGGGGGSGRKKTVSMFCAATPTVTEANII